MMTVKHQTGYRQIQRFVGLLIIGVLQAPGLVVNLAINHQLQLLS